MAARGLTFGFMQAGRQALVASCARIKNALRGLQPKSFYREQGRVFGCGKESAALRQRSAPSFTGSIEARH